MLWNRLNGLGCKIMNARFGKEAGTLAKAALSGLEHNRRSKEGCESHSLAGNLTDALA
jgi:hypothetical protein